MKIKVEIIESERGWGQKVDEVREFDTEEEADAFIKKFNQKMNDNSSVNVPDYYEYAQKVTRY